MPDAKLTAALDLDRFDEIARQADLGVNLWSAFRLAAERGERELVEHHIRQIIILTRSANALVKRLGQADPDEAPRHG